MTGWHHDELCERFMIVSPIPPRVRNWLASQQCDAAIAREFALVGKFEQAGDYAARAHATQLAIRSHFNL